MSPDKLKEIISKLTYKPDSKIELVMEDLIHGVYSIKITLTVPCRDTLKPIAIVQSSRVDHRFLKSTMDVTGWIRSQIGQMEMHERDEWIKLSGIRIYEPHEEIENDLRSYY